ncbi:hypothetical protein BCR44DRAFT_1514641 [Catenaria anguillulae PL171]|uniref:Uncharacterized protein n=1 Tax=Catenaria anguillulae PL171 TaxID=765915 RepID=A0A1Y2HHH6_9FUNG|nr:hypothetical protein BCR44DRAFT_1514641 [Catenaria anguillulae PL171]
MDPPTIVTALWLAAAGRSATQSASSSIPSSTDSHHRPRPPQLLRKSKKRAQDQVGGRAHDARNKRLRPLTDPLDLARESARPGPGSTSKDLASLYQVSATLLGRALDLGDWSVLDKSMGSLEAMAVVHVQGDESAELVEPPQELLEAWHMLWEQSQRYWVETILTLFDLAILFGDPFMSAGEQSASLATVRSSALASTSRKAVALVCAVAGSHANSTQAQMLWHNCPKWIASISKAPTFASRLLHLYISNHLLHLATSPAPTSELLNSPAHLSALLRCPPKWHRRLASVPANPLLSQLASDALFGAAKLLGPAASPSATTLVTWLLRTGANPSALIHILSVLHTLSAASPQCKAALESTISAILTQAVHTPNLVHFTFGLLLVRTLLARTPNSYEQWLASVVWSNTLSLFPTAPALPPLSSSWFHLLADLIPHDDPTYLAAHMRASSAAPPPTHVFGGSMAAQATCPWRPAAHAYHKRLVERVGEFGGEDASKDAVWVLQQVLGPAPAPAAGAAAAGKGGKAANAAGKAKKGGAAGGGAGLARTSSTGAFRPIPDTLFSWCLVKRKWVEQRLLPAFWGIYSGSAPGVEIAGASPGTIRRAIGYIMEALIKNRKMTRAMIEEWHEVRDDPTAATAAGMGPKEGGAAKGIGQEEGGPGATQGVIGTQMPSVEDARMTLIVRLGVDAKCELRTFGASLMTCVSQIDAIPQAVRLQHLMAFTLNSPSSPLAPTHNPDLAAVAALARTLASLLSDQSQHWPGSSTFAHIDAPLCAPWTSLAPPGSMLLLNPLDMLLLPWLTQPYDPMQDHFIAALFLACVERTLAGGTMPMYSMFAASHHAAWPWQWSVEALHKLRFVSARYSQEIWMQSVASILSHEDAGLIATPVHWVAAWMAEERPVPQPCARKSTVPVCGSIVDLVLVAFEVGLHVAVVRELIKWLVDGVERDDLRIKVKRWKRELKEPRVHRLGSMGCDMVQAAEVELDRLLVCA